MVHLKGGDPVLCTSNVQYGVFIFQRKLIMPNRIFTTLEMESKLL